MLPAIAESISAALGFLPGGSDFRNAVAVIIGSNDRAIMAFGHFIVLLLIPVAVSRGGQADPFDHGGISHEVLADHGLSLLGAGKRHGTALLCYLVLERRGRERLRSRL